MRFWVSIKFEFSKNWKISKKDDAIAPMTGTVTAVYAKSGDTVAKGDC